MDFDLVIKLRDIWRRWHLNDMRAGCPHQRDWGKKTLTLNHYQINANKGQAQRMLRDDKMLEMSKVGRAALTREERALWNLPYHVIQAHTLVAPADYYLARTEQKTSGWLRTDKHPEGVLGKPCPSCGFQYGTAWQYEALPDDVEKFIREEVFTK